MSPIADQGTGSNGGGGGDDPYTVCVHGCEDVFNAAQTAALTEEPEIASVLIEAARKAEEACIMNCDATYGG